MNKQIINLTAILIGCFCQPLTILSQSTVKTPVIVITDLYHPAQDPGDNFDLITAFALSQIDLKAVILDCTEPFRQPVATNPGEGLYPDPNGPREPGYIPVLQLNYIFDRTVPFATGPFNKMKNEQDKMLDIPSFQQQGIGLLLETLRNSSLPVQIVSFGSARVIAVSFNRDPELFKNKVAQINLSAGSAGPDFLEWNVALDRAAINTLLNSDLPIALYPCAAHEANGMGYGSYNYPFSYSNYNTYFKLPNLSFISKMDIMLQRYLAYTFNRSLRNDFLRAMENDSVLITNMHNYNHEHYVWETAIWLQVAGMELISDASGSYRIVSKDKLKGSEHIIKNELHPCKIQLCPNGYTFEETQSNSNFSIFFRENPYLYEKAMQTALPELYRSYRSVLVTKQKVTN